MAKTPRGAGTEHRMWITDRQEPRLRPDRYPTTEREARIEVSGGTGLAAVIIEPVLPVRTGPGRASFAEIPVIGADPAL